jgi:hypothetical protein
MEEYQRLLRCRAADANERQNLEVAACFNYQDNPPATFREGLCFGCEQAALDLAWMRSRGITHVLNAAGRYSANFYPDYFNYLTLDLADEEDTVLPLQQAYDFMRS